MDEESIISVEAVESDTAHEPAARRERSKIVFPYGDLDDALEVVRPINAKGRNDADESQLSVWMNETTDSGVFRRKLGVARIFGLVRLEKDRVFLTDTGKSIDKSESAIQAKAQAFLTVPLYRKLYDTYQGRSLPNDVDLEIVLESFGVAPKQKGRARRDFQRSAEQAGMFNDRKDRLALPAGVSLDSAIPNGGGQGRKMEAPQAPQAPQAAVTIRSDGINQSLLASLIEELPATGEWTRDEHDLWMRIFVRTVDKLYKVKE